MILLIFSNAGLAFINFLPEKTVVLLILQIFANICTATAILHILSFYHFSKPNKWINLIPLGGVIVLFIIIYYNKDNLFTQIYMFDNNRLFLNPYYKDLLSNKALALSRITLIITFLVVYFSLVFQLIKKYKSYNNSLARKLRNWVLLLVITPLLIVLQNIVFAINPDLIINGWITSFMYHLNALIFLYRPDFINRSYLKKKLFESTNEKDEQAYFNEKIFINEFYNKSYFTNPKASIKEFAEMIHISQNELLRFINTKFSCSFNELLQKKRIELFKEFAAKSEYKHYSIEGLAMKVGFASRQSFYIAFKKLDGGSPTDLLD
jgi:AraC-like DNA-binding protein